VFYLSLDIAGKSPKLFEAENVINFFFSIRKTRLLPGFPFPFPLITNSIGTSKKLDL